MSLEYRTGGFNDDEAPLFDYFFAVIPIICRTTPSWDRALRDKLADFGAAFWDHLKAVPVFKEIMAEIVDFVVDVVKKCRSGHNGDFESACRRYDRFHHVGAHTPSHTPTGLARLKAARK